MAEFLTNKIFLVLLIFGHVSMQNTLALAQDETFKPKESQVENIKPKIILDDKFFEETDHNEIPYENRECDDSLSDILTGLSRAKHIFSEARKLTVRDISINDAIKNPSLILKSKDQSWKGVKAHLRMLEGLFYWHNEYSDRGALEELYTVFVAFSEHIVSNSFFDSSGLAIDRYMKDYGLFMGSLNRLGLRIQYAQYKLGEKDIYSKRGGYYPYGATASLSTVDGLFLRGEYLNHPSFGEEFLDFFEFQYGREGSFVSTAEKQRLWEYYKKEIATAKLYILQTKKISQKRVNYNVAHAINFARYTDIILSSGYLTDTQLLEILHDFELIDQQSNYVCSKYFQAKISETLSDLKDGLGASKEELIKGYEKSLSLISPTSHIKMRKRINKKIYVTPTKVGVQSQ